MSQQEFASLLHIGICVSDLERSLRFYTEGLGFAYERDVGEIGAPFDKLMELPGKSLKAHHVRCGDLRLELISFDETEGAGERCAMNQLGFTHMTLMVDDIDSACNRVEEFGGKALRDTKVDSPYGPIVFCTDPDGLRVELMGRID